MNFMQKYNEMKQYFEVKKQKLREDGHFGFVLQGEMWMNNITTLYSNLSF